MDVRPGHVPAFLPEQEARLSVETLGQLAGQFAHDINNLLATVLSGTELAAIEGDGRARRLLDEVADAARRLSAFADAMANAARLGERARVLDAHALVEACSADLRAALDPCALDLRLDAADACIRCDPAFLRAALLHLAANARAAMPRDGRLVLATRNRDGRGGTPGRGVLLLTAVDNGSGMTEDVRRRAFEPFFSTRKGADGLGLPQVRDTARRAGGWVALETAQGQGTSVSLAIPLADRADAWHGT